MIYLMLAIIGAIVPVVYFNDWAIGFGPGAFKPENANHANIVMMLNLLIASIALVVFAISECVARKDYWALLAIPVIFVAGLGCAFPLYLFLRTRPMD